MDIRFLFRLFWAILVLVVFAAGPAGAQRAGATLRGTAFDAKTGEPLVGATVRVLGSDLGAAVGLNGSFVLHELPAGAATVQCQSVGFVPQQQQMTLVAGQTLTVSFRLAAGTQTLGEVAVLGQVDRESDTGARRAEQKADNVLNIISAHTIELSPDITVGNVVQRASGVSVVRNSSGDGQYAIIRGMDPRYNYTLVNGIKIPSPDPRNRYVPLDIFPAELLERLEVVKALTPNMEGDAIGGAMNLIMKSAPDHFLVAATASTGYGDLFDQRAFSGFSTHGLAMQSPDEQGGKNNLATAANFSKAPLNYAAATPINTLLGLTLGNRTHDGRLGLVVAGSYQRTFRGSNSLYYHPLGQPLPEPANTFTFDQLQHREYSALQTRGGLHAKLDYVLSPRHRFSLYSMAVQLDEAQHRHTTVGDLGMAGDVPVSDRSRFRRQRILNETIQGDHTLAPRLSLNWSGVYSLATAETPDQMDAGYKISTGPNTAKGVFLTDVKHTWTHNRDQDWAGYLNLRYAVTAAFELSAGGLGRTKSRSSYYDYYDLIPVTNGTGDQQGFTSYDAARYTFKLPGDGSPKASDGNNYTATENIVAGYGQAKLNLLENKLQLLGGVRVEHTYLHYDSQVPPSLPGKAATYNYLDWLPSVHLRYALNGQQNLRLSYFKGISRPSFYELVPAVIPGEDFDEQGNYKLRHIQSDNVDLRYEYFGPANSQLLGGVFYKRIIDPIERAFAQVSNGSFNYQPINSGNATNYGAELQFIRYLRHWGLNGNYTYTHSAITTTKRVYYRSANGQLVTASEGQPTSEYPSVPTQTRPLQGQSDHIANLALLYRDETHGLHAQLAGVYTGRRINIVSPYKDLDQWQRATTQLDFSAEQRLPGGFTLFGKVTNLLNTPIIVEVMQAPNAALLSLPEQNRADRTLVQRDEFNRTYQLGLRYRLQ